ncbi:MULTISPECIES: hypothetical protein [unclassified Halobacteriovorax]|uniref:hypothetical protein n=1 Tax=unclassified Halobacteriovorax TaxID=2639665 RepID=UPI003999F09B
MNKPRQFGKSEVVIAERVSSIASSTTGDGRMLPVIFIDIRDRTDILDLIKVHEDGNQGDVVSCWGIRKILPKHIFLTLEFKNPMPIFFAIQFDLKDFKNAVDLIINAKGAYILPTCYAKNIKEGVSAPKILIEIPPGTKPKYWDNLYYKLIYKSFKKDGMSKKKATEATNNYIIEFRKINKIRV